jgi:hypothetical protein
LQSARNTLNHDSILASPFGRPIFDCLVCCCSALQHRISAAFAPPFFNAGGRGWALVFGRERTRRTVALALDRVLHPRYVTASRSLRVGLINITVS